MLLAIMLPANTPIINYRPGTSLSIMRYQTLVLELREYLGLAVPDYNAHQPQNAYICQEGGPTIHLAPKMYFEK